MRSTRAGLFVAFEGLDGCGKSTQMQRVRLALQAHGHDVHVTAEPSHGTIGTLIRQHALKAAEHHAYDEATLALMFAADRLHHVAHDIAPALQDGRIVLCDRYVLSSLAYQSQHLPMEWVMQLNAQARHADATLFFQLTPEIAAQRRQLRNHDASRFETVGRQRAVAAAFEEAMAKYGHGEQAILGTCVVIDATPEEHVITQHVVDVIAQLRQRQAAP